MKAPINWKNIPTPLRESIEYLVECTQLNARAIEDVRSTCQLQHHEHAQLLETLAASISTVKDQSSEETQATREKYSKKLKKLNEDMREFSLQHNTQRREDRQLLNALKTALNQEIEKTQAFTRELITRKERLISDFFDRRMDTVDSRLYGFDE